MAPMNRTPNAMDINAENDVRTAEGKRSGAAVTKRDKLENSRASAINIMATVYRLTLPIVEGVDASFD